VSDTTGRVASYVWLDGRLVVAKDGLDHANAWPGFRYEYAGTNLAAVTSSENDRIEYTYDSSARVVAARRMGEGDPAYTFGYFGAQGAFYRSSSTNPLGEVVNFRFDSAKRIQSLELPAVAETTSFLWSGRRISTLTRPDGVETSFQITNDDVTQISEASGNVTTIGYAPHAIDPANPRRRPIDFVSDSLGTLHDRAFDAQGRLASVENGAGDRTEYLWNSGSPIEPASVRSALGVVTTFSNYGSHGHPGRAVAGTLREDYEYDAVGNLRSGPEADTEVSPGMGGVESRTFDADRNVATVSLWEQLPPTFHSESLVVESRSDGRPRAIRRPHGGDTEFDYSPSGRLVTRREKVSGAWATTTFGYDALDRVTSHELANGMRSEFAYDAVGRIRTIVSKRSSLVEATLTRTFANGRLTASLDSAWGGAETYAYDGAGRVSVITYPGGERLELSYDVRSRVVSERFVDEAERTALELDYAYDLANRVVEIRRQPGNHALVTYTYTNGFVTRTDYGNGLHRTATPDLDHGLPATTVTRNAQAQTLENTQNQLTTGLFHYRYSTIAGTPTTESFGICCEWRLDHSIQERGEPDLPGYQVWWEEGGLRWDALSNLRRTSDREFLYNAEATRLEQVRDVAAPHTVRHTYAYDAAGFVTSRDGVTLDYDATGAIASIGTLASFEHDLDGRPVSRTLHGVTKAFRFGGAIAYTTAGTPLERDLGEVVVKLDGTGDRYRHLDFRGNVLFLTNAAGSVVGQAVYRGFGRVLVDGNLGERGFAGGFEIASLELVVLGPRVLDSDTGRFLSQDPVFNAVNQYAYAQGNPVFFWDPTGLTASVAVRAAFGAAMLVGGTLAVAAFAPAAVVAATGAVAATAGAQALGALGSAAVFAGGAAIGAGTLNMAMQALGGPFMTASDFAGNFLPDVSGVSADLGSISNAAQLANAVVAALDNVATVEALIHRSIEVEGVRPGNGDVSFGGGVLLSAGGFALSAMY
jgi:RHS repeat-associated protein